MTPDALTRKQRLALACMPHMKHLLDDLNPHGLLRVRDLSLEQSAPPMLESQCRVAGLDPAAALAWAEANATAPMLRVDTPTIHSRACTLWFGKICVRALSQAYLRLEIPLAPWTQTRKHEALLVLNSDADGNTKALDAWAANERLRLAENGVERYLRPVLRQSEDFGAQPIALGLRTAILRLPAPKAAALFACTVPVLMSGWIDSCAQALAMNAPRLRRIEATLKLDVVDREPPGQLSVKRLHLISSNNESMWVRPNESDIVWHEHEDVRHATLERMSALTGTGLQTPEAAESFVQELAVLMLLQYQARGVRQIVLLPSANLSPGDLNNTF